MKTWRMRRESLQCYANQVMIFVKISATLMSIALACAFLLASEFLHA